MSQRSLALALMLVIPFSLAFSDAAAVPSAGKNQAGDKAAQLEQLYTDYWEASLMPSPLRATQVGDARYNDLLSNTFTKKHRYIAIPGQALAYKIGELKLKELRAKAEKELGSQFDIRGFHTVVLKDGSVPLDVLEAKIDAWISSEKIIWVHQRARTNEQ